MLAPGTYRCQQVDPHCRSRIIDTAAGALLGPRSRTRFSGRGVIEAVVVLLAGGFLWLTTETTPAPLR
jgi:hypothetical protein